MRGSFPGVDLAGRKLVPMAQLRTLVEALGFADVRTLLNSGKVVFTDGQAASVGRRWGD